MGCQYFFSISSFRVPASTSRLRFCDKLFPITASSENPAVTVELMNIMYLREPSDVRLDLLKPLKQKPSDRERYPKKALRSLEGKLEICQCLRTV